MSPEQAAGKPADRRSDLWAFGVVLFEIHTGRRAFAGESVSHVLAAMLQTEPAWRAPPSATAPQIISLLRRCLTKEPRQRLDGTDVDVLTLRPALDELAVLDARQAQIEELRDLAGPTEAEVAEITRLSPATERRDVAGAKSWLGRRMRVA